MTGMTVPIQLLCCGVVAAAEPLTQVLVYLEWRKMEETPVLVMLRSMMKTVAMRVLPFVLHPLSS